jgi:6-phosphofructokinase
LASGAEEILIPEKKLDFNHVCHDIVQGNLKGKISWIIVVAEGAGGAEEVAKQVQEMTDLEVRHVVLGHVQRGGSPLAREAEICYASISTVTDYDVWKDHVVCVDDILATMKKNVETVKNIIAQTVAKMPTECSCACGQALKGAFV